MNGGMVKWSYYGLGVPSNIHTQSGVAFAQLLTTTRIAFNHRKTKSPRRSTPKIIIVHV